MLSFLTKCVILSLSRLSSIWDTKPNCKGEPLKPEQFSNQGNVEFIRDVCVDIVARNFYNYLEFPVSKSCEELANLRISTGFFKCFKWKQSSKCHEKVTNEIMAKAETLMEELLKIVSLNAPRNEYKSAGEFVYECTEDAKRRLIDSEAYTENSKIVDQLEDLKNFLCRHCAISDSKDLIDVINQFIINFEAQNSIKIIRHHAEDTVVEEITQAGIVRLRFDYEGSGNTIADTVIVKIPSLAPFYYTKRKNKDMYLREAYFYEKLLPALYQMGKCEPFAPRLYAVTKASALILEDLSVEGYENELKSNFLDLDHNLIFMKTLAQYHALSYKYFQDLNKDDPNIQLIGSRQPQIRMTMGKDEFDMLCGVIKPLLSETIYKKIVMAEEEILTKTPAKNKNDKNSMTVIIHGDLHRKNFLFKYDSDGRVCKVKLIDWQFSREASPILDLIEFFVHNIHAEIFEANEDYLLEHYLASFNHNLSLLSTSQRYNRPELDRDMEFFKYLYYSILSHKWRWVLKHAEQDKKQHATNIAKWLIYLDRKGFIEDNIFHGYLID